MTFTFRHFKKIVTQFHLRLLTSYTESNAPISWLHYMEDPTYVSWLKGNELILITGSIIGSSPVSLKQFIDQIYEKEAAGLIINLSPYIHTIPKEVIDYANFLGFPLFEMPAECAIIEISESVCKALVEHTVINTHMETLLNNIICENPKITNSILKRAISYGYSSISSYYCILFQPMALSSFNVSKGTDIFSDHDLLVDFENYILPNLPLHDIELLQVHLQSQLLFLLPVNTDTEDFLNCDLESLLTNYEKKTNVRIISGISPKWTDLIHLRENYKKAALIMDFIPLSTKDLRILRYENMDGLFLLLSKYKHSDIESCFQNSLKPLRDYDEQNEGELVNTLYSYIQNNAVLNDTAASLFIHVNTLRYRLRLIEQLLHCSLKNLTTLFSLYLDIRIYTYLSVKEQ